MALVPFIAAEDVGNRFLDLLRRCGIEPPPASMIEDELLSLTQLIEVTKNPALATGPDRVAVLRAAAGMHDLAAKVLSVEHLPEFPKCLEHLRLIAQRKQPASLNQMASSGVYDDTARKMAELYLGSLAAHCGEGIEFDHPTKAKGDNPDVIFGYRNKRWALAIKTISARSGQTIFERIEDGAGQIDRESCPADVGLVVINAKNAIDHGALWSPPHPFVTLDEAQAAMAAELDRLIASAAENRPQEEWDKLFEGRTLRPILFMGQSLVILPTALGQRTPTPLKMLRKFDAGGTVDPVAHELATALNHFMQTILIGRPGSPGCPPA